MRKKVVSKTYLRDVEKYALTFFCDDEKDYYVVTKKIAKVSSPFVLSSGEKVIDNGYYIVEITPKNENYNVRVYLNEKKQIIEHYIDVSAENGLDPDAKMPYYCDLFTDIIILGDKVRVLDLDELKSALNDGVVTQNDFDLAERTKEKLLNEIATKSNKYINLNLDEYLK